MIGNRCVKLVSPVPPPICFLMCAKVGEAFFEVCLVWISAVAAFEGGVKPLFALDRAVRLAPGMNVGWVLSSTLIAVGVICALGGVVSKG